MATHNHMKHWMFLIEEFHSEFNPDLFLERLRGVMTLMRQGAYEGEKSGAKLAFSRLMDRAKTEIARMRQPDSGVTHADLARFIRLLDQVTNAKPEQPRRPNPEPRKPNPEPRQSAAPIFKVGDWVKKDNGECGKITKVHDFANRGILYVVKFVEPEDQYTVRQSELRKATQEDIDAALASKQSKQHKSRSSEHTGLTVKTMARYVNARENSDKVYGIVDREGKTFTFWGGNRKSLAVKYFAHEHEAYRQYDSKVARGYEPLSLPAFEQAKNDWVLAALKAKFAKMAA